MAEVGRYSWKKMPSDYHASYYNHIDLKNGKQFVIIDNATGQEYKYPVYENRRDSHERIYAQRVIDPALWNQEFMNWACRTSPDFAYSIPENFLSKELIMTVINHASDPDFIRRVPLQSLTQDMCTLSVRLMPRSFSGVPMKFRTSELYEIAYFNRIISFTRIPKESLTQKICNDYMVAHPELIGMIPARFRGNDEISALIKKHSQIISKIPREFYTKEIYENGYLNGSITYEEIPERGLTQKICDDFLSKDPANIEFIPEEYQTQVMVQELISKHPRLIGKIARKYLTYTLINGAVMQDSLSLAFVPKEYRTKPLCEMAVIKGCSLSHVPVEHRDYSLCKLAVMNQPSQIRYVPLHVLTASFYDEFVTMGVIFSERDIKYIQKCIDLNSPFEQRRHSKENEEGTRDYSEFSFILLSELTGFFSPNTLEILNNNDIFTLKDLFERSSKASFIEIFTVGRESFKRVYDQVLGNIRLLRCKYLNEPFIIDQDMPIADFVNKMGFSTITSNALKQSKLTSARELINIVRSNEQEKLLRIRKIGENCLREIVEKCSVVILGIERGGYSDDLQTLLEELKTLMETRKAVEGQITVIQQKIKDQDYQKVKGGVSK